MSFFRWRKVSSFSPLSYDLKFVLLVSLSLRQALLDRELECKISEAREIKLDQLVFSSFMFIYLFCEKYIAFTLKQVKILYRIQFVCLYCLALWLIMSHLAAYLNF